MSKLDDFGGNSEIAAEYSDKQGCPISDSGYHCSCYDFEHPCCLCDRDEQYCPVGDSLLRDPSKDPARNMHCTCWYDGDGCCRCKAQALTAEQRKAQGMDD